MEEEDQGCVDYSRMVPARSSLQRGRLMPTATMNQTEETYSGDSYWYHEDILNVTVSNSTSVFQSPLSPLVDKAISCITIIILFITMVSLGCTMEISKIKAHILKPKGVAIAVVAQYGIMPLTAFTLAKVFQLGSIESVTVLICGCCPGGNLSNIFALALKGDMNLREQANLRSLFAGECNSSGESDKKAFYSHVKDFFLGSVSIAFFLKRNSSFKSSHIKCAAVLVYFPLSHLSQGFMEDSYLFYGFYPGAGLTQLSYNLPLMYLLCSVGVLFLSLLWVVTRLGRDYKVRWVQGRQYKTQLSFKIFAGWDFCIRETDSAMLKQSRIRNDLKRLTAARLLLTMFSRWCQMDLEEEKYHQRVSNQTVKQRALLCLIRVVLNLIVLTLLAGAFFLIYQATQVSQSYQQEAYNFSVTVSFLIEYLPSMSITLINFLLPQVFRRLVKFEDYLLTTQINLTLVRVLVEKCSWRLVQFIGKDRFLVPLNVLNIVYSQTLTWTGLFYCPLLPLLNSAMLFLTFYIKKFSLYNNCQPAKRMFRSSSSSVFFQCVLLLGLFLALVSVGVSISIAHQGTIEELKEKLVMDVTDKRFLVKKLSALAKKYKDELDRNASTDSSGDGPSWEDLVDSCDMRPAVSHLGHSEESGGAPGVHLQEE
ncbi:UNVERIFIED_CONTAM: hypothetical protein FKN15_049481 [Acipenser sinensis]